MNITGTQPSSGSYQPPDNDSVNKSIRDRIDALKSRLEKLSENDKIDPKEKAKQREEINKQISELETQLEQRKAQQRKNGGAAAERHNRDRFEPSDKMDELLSAEMSVKRSEAYGGARNILERTARTLKGEIRSDKKRGIDTSKKEADLSEINSRMDKLSSAQASEAKKSLKTEKPAREEKLTAGLEYLAGLKKQIPGTAFFIGTVSYGQTYGNSTDNNFVVHPKYLEKLSDDPEERRKFEETVEHLNSYSKQFRQSQAAQGREVLSEGWFCDENGNWGGWSVTRSTNTGSRLQEMRERSDKINEQKTEKRKNAEKLQQKREKLRVRKNGVRKTYRKVGHEKAADGSAKPRVYNVSEKEVRLDVKV